MYYLTIDTEGMLKGLYFEMNKVKKVIIVGLSGSGKTTLGVRLAAGLGVDFVELDAINHQEGWRQLDEALFRERVSRAMSANGWVIDGNYFSRLGLSFWKKADMVIWLNRPLPVTLYRLLKRTLHRTITREELWNGNRESFFSNFFSKDSVIYFMLKKRRSLNKKYNSIFRSRELGGQTTLVRLRTDREVDDFLKRLCGSQVSGS